MIDKHKPHMQRLWSRGHRVLGTFHYILSAWARRRAAPWAPFSTPVSTPNLTAVVLLGACFSQPPLYARVDIANAGHARSQTGNSRIGGAIEGSVPRRGLDGYAQGSNLI